MSQESRTEVRPSRKGDDVDDALLEGGEAGGLDLGEGAFGDGVADLVVVVAVDEDDEAAVVDVAEAVFGVAGLAGEAEPEDVDGDAVVDEREVGGDARDGVAAIAAYGEVRGDFDGPLGVLASTPVVMPSCWRRPVASQPMRRVKFG